MIAVLFLLSVHGALAAPDVSPDWEDARTRADTQVAVVTALVNSGMDEKALAVIADVRAQGGHDGRLDVLQARALHATGMHAEARGLLDAHTKAQPRDADGWAALGVVLADTGDVPGSIKALERARHLSPDDPDILNNLGWVHLSGGHADRAVALFQASLAKNPAQPRTRNNLGFALARLERDTEALEAFRAAGSEADARYNLGVACVNRGDKTTAISEFQAALRADPKHAAANAALGRLLQEAR